MRLAVAVALYVLSGVVQAPLTDLIRYHGAVGSRLQMLPTLANVVGMASVALLPLHLASARASPKAAASRAACSSLPQPPLPPRSSAVRWRLLALAAVDLLSGVCITGGLLVVGSATFVVVYSSCTAWTAVVSRLWLGRRLSGQQVAGIAFLCGGLAINALSNTAAVHHGATHGHHHGPVTDAATAPVSGPEFLAGTLVLLAGSVLHSLMFVLSELLLASHPSVTPWSLCATMGRVETVALVAWNLVLAATTSTATDYAHSVHNAAGSLPTALLSLVALTACCAVHAASFFSLLGALGSVSIAVMKGLQMVAVWCFSAVVLCQYQEAQCFTLPKAASVAVVCVGMAVYAKAPAYRKHCPTPPNVVAAQSGASPPSPGAATV